MNLKKRSYLWSVLVAVPLALSPIASCLAKVPLAHFGANTVKLEVADTQQKIEKGLMFRRSLPENNGMVFLFHPMRDVRFWMFNCFISLDMIYINNGRIIKISHDVPPCREADPEKCPRYPEDGNVTVTEVVEVSAGYCKRHGVKEGDTVKFEFLDPVASKAPAADSASSTQPTKNQTN